MTSPTRRDAIETLDRMLADLARERRLWNRIHAAAWAFAMATAAYAAAHRGHWLLLVGTTSALTAFGLTANHLHHRAATRDITALTDAMRDRPDRIMNREENR